jgi:ligand-binding sensor domain-containing protein
MKLRLAHILLILIGGWHIALASNKLKFEYITPNEGLTQATVTNIIQDTIGFMWFGTKNGLNRYDGYNLVKYYHNPLDSTSLPSNIIEKILIGSHSNMWVGTSEGICRYNYKLDNFDNYLFAGEESNKLVNYSLSSIYEDSNGRIWVGIYHHGLNLFNPENGSFTHFYHQSGNQESISSNNIHAILEDKNYCQRREMIN